MSKLDDKLGGEFEVLSYRELALLLARDEIRRRGLEALGNMFKQDMDKDKVVDEGMKDAFALDQMREMVKWLEGLPDEVCPKVTLDEMASGFERRFNEVRDRVLGGGEQ